MDSTSLIAQSTAQARDAYASAMATRAQQAAATGGGGTKNMQQMKAAAQKFEAFFVGQMMEYMMAGLKTDETFGGGQAEDTWRSLLNQEYGKEIAKSGKLGIADSVMKSMIKVQEQRDEAQQRLKQMKADNAAGMTIAPMNAAVAPVAAKAAKLDITT
jgi:Rod binding domain-containing protein